MRYLFVMAHPDDEADVGGTIYKLGKQGHDVAVAILVGKAAARRNLSSKLQQEEQASMDLLGVKRFSTQTSPISKQTQYHILNLSSS